MEQVANHRTKKDEASKQKIAYHVGSARQPYDPKTGKMKSRYREILKLRPKNFFENLTGIFPRQYFISADIDVLLGHEHADANEKHSALAWSACVALSHRLFSLTVAAPRQGAKACPSKAPVRSILMDLHCLLPATG
jgi:hypothetical protein